LALIGGILLILDKTIGGILPIIAGIVSVIGYQFWIIEGAVSVRLVGNLYYIDPILMLVGAIIGLAAGKE
jgi:hypothetical protein